MITLTLPYPPSANRIWRHYRGRPVLSEEGKTYKAEAALIASRKCDYPLSGRLAVTINVYRPRKSGDLDNRIKIALDAMQGVLFLNDNQITEIHAYRHDDKLNPRIEVEVKQV